MKILKIVLITLLSLLILVSVWYGLIIIASESGEVVSLYTLDESAERKTTRLWIVDYEKKLYLRSGSTESGWFKRISSSSLVELERHGVVKPYRPELAPELRDAINQSISKKYGWAETCIDFFLSRDDAVPVRLVAIDS